MVGRQEIDTGAQYETGQQQDDGRCQCTGRPETAIGQHVGKGRRGDLDTAQVHAIVIREHRVEPVRLAGIVEIGQADKHHLAGKVQCAGDSARHCSTAL